VQRQSGKIRNQERINNNGINTFNNIFRVGWLIVNAMAEIPPFLSLNEMEVELQRFFPHKVKHI